MKSNAGERDTNTDSHQILVAFIIKSFRLNEFPLAFVSVTRISTYICIYIYIYKYIDSYSYPIPPTVLGLSPILSSMRKAGSRRAQNKHWLCIFVCDSPAVSSTDMAGNVWHFLRGKLDLVLIRKLLKIIPKRRRWAGPMNRSIYHLACSLRAPEEKMHFVSMDNAWVSLSCSYIIMVLFNCMLKHTMAISFILIKA